MGTNFYWNPELVQQAFGISDVDQDDPRVHIGKRSAMTGYCKPCGVTRAGHTIYVHADKEHDREANFRFIKQDCCPNCGQPWDNTTTSFTFTMMGHLVTISNFYNIEMAQRQKDPLIKPLEIVIDEMGRPYTAVDFLDTVIRVCPVQFQDYGRWS